MTLEDTVPVCGLSVSGAGVLIEDADRVLDHDRIAASEGVGEPRGVGRTEAATAGRTSP